MKKRKYPRLSYEEIEKILVGDAEAMNALVKLYTPYIKVLSMVTKKLKIW